MRSTSGQAPAMGRPWRRIVAAAVALGALALPATATAQGSDDPGSGIDRVVVIYQENHSFDNLYGRWERVGGLSDADAAHTRQVNQQGAPYTCLLQNDVNLASPPQTPNCRDTT